MTREVCARLRQWIIEGVLRPGEVIRDQALAAQLGVSRTPVREALLCLEAEGFVESARNRWTRVTRISIQTAQEIYPLVETLEVMALRLQASSFDPQLTSALRKANRKLIAAIDKRSWAAAMDADAEFHRLLVARAGNAELIATLEALTRKLRRVELAYFSRASAASTSASEHKRIIGAIEKKDAKAACVALRTNWRNSLQRLKDMAQHGAPPESKRTTASPSKAAVRSGPTRRQP
jgi:DNA-binding GntR family transcriptional regulator